MTCRSTLSKGVPIGCQISICVQLCKLLSKRTSTNATSCLWSKHDIANSVQVLHRHFRSLKPKLVRCLWVGLTPRRAFNKLNPKSTTDVTAKLNSLFHTGKHKARKAVFPAMSYTCSMHVWTSLVLAGLLCCKKAAAACKHKRSPQTSSHSQTGWIQLV